MRFNGIKTLLAAFASLALIMSCEEDTTLRYGNVTMGNMVEGTFISDQGNIFNVVEQTCKGDLSEHERSLIICDVLQKTDDKTYDIKLHRIERVLAKPSVPQSAATDEMQIEDPVDIYDAWCSGGYLNMYIVFYVKSGSETAHFINLIQDESTAKEGVYSFTLKHNAYGEVPGEENPTMILAGAYVSFPLSEIVKEDTAEIGLQWKWYAPENTDGEELQNYKGVVDWKKSLFEHTPSKTAKLSIASIN